MPQFPPLHKGPQRKWAPKSPLPLPQVTPPAPTPPGAADKTTGTVPPASPRRRAGWGRAAANVPWGAPHRNPGDRRRGGHGGSDGPRGRPRRDNGWRQRRVAPAALQPARRAAPSGTAPPHLRLGPHPAGSPRHPPRPGPPLAAPGASTPPTRLPPPASPPGPRADPHPLGLRAPGKERGEGRDAPERAERGRGRPGLGGGPSAGGGAPPTSGGARGGGGAGRGAAREERLGRPAAPDGAPWRPEPAPPRGRGRAGAPQPQRTGRDAGTRGGGRCCREKEGGARRGRSRGTQGLWDHGRLRRGTRCL